MGCPLYVDPTWKNSKSKPDKLTYQELDLYARIVKAYQNITIKKKCPFTMLKSMKRLVVTNRNFLPQLSGKLVPKLTKKRFERVNPIKINNPDTEFLVNMATLVYFRILKHVAKFAYQEIAHGLIRI